MGLGYLVCHYCPAGNSVWTIEHDDHQAAAATYEEHVRRWPDTPISLRWGAHVIRKTPGLEMMDRLRLEMSMNDVLHGRDLRGLGLPWSHPEAAKAWGSMPEEPKRSGRKRRW